MNVKKYTAATTRDALRMVREELGDEAVILSNRKVATGVEIMAMSDEALANITEAHAQTVATHVQPEIPQLNDSVQVPRHTADTYQPAPWLQKAAAEKAAAQRQPAAPAKVLPRVIKQEAVPAERATKKIVAAPQQLEPSPASSVTQVAASAEQQHLLKEIKSMHTMLQEQFSCMAWSDMQQRDPKRTRLLRNLVNAGFSAELAHQFLDKMPADADMPWVSQVLTHNLQVAAQADDVVVRGGIYALTGPTGVGKTTTTAKLAARAVVRYGADSVALITTDSYRIGALEQLRIYGKILGVSVHAARDTSDLRLTLSGLKHKRLVLIDTMGMGQRDKRVAEQTSMFNEAGVQRLMLLNATSSGDTLEDVVNMYHGPGVIGCIATKLDEAVTLGALLDVMVRHKLPLHYVANGQRVPEDLHEVNKAYLLHRAFEPANKPSAFTARELDIPALMAGQSAGVMTRSEHVA